MKLKTMLYGLTLMLGCFVLASCVNDEEGPCLPDGKTQVIFSLVLPDNAQTRAEDPYWEEGVGIDNNIDLSSIKLLIYDGSGVCKGILTSANLTYIPRQTKTERYEETVYDCIGTVPATIKNNLVANTEYRFVILANCNASIANTISWSDLSKVTFPRTQESMPMWGVQSGTLSLKAGESMYLGTITLLRAKAKVTVKLGADSTDDTSTSGDTTGGTTSETVDKLDGFTYIKSVQVLNYSNNGFIVPEVAADVTATPEDLAVSRIGYEVGTGDFIVQGSTSTDSLSLYLLEYKNSEAAAETEAKLIVTLGKMVNEKEEIKTFDFAPIKFCTYVDGKPSGTPFDIVRNHHYKFTITEVVGGLYVVPTIADWAPAPVLNYDIKMSTNMRLFDSWLYRYDTDGDYADYTKWATSHMAVSDGRESDGRPSRSPQIQLVTTGVADPDVSGSGTFELVVDNNDFEIVRANKNEIGVVSSYDASVNGKLTIAAGTNVYTYFYIVPKVGVTPTNSVAKVSLFYNDPVTGKQEVTFNYGALPGYSDDSSEIWAYYFPAAQYNITGKLKMYYQDANHPLVPTPVQN